MTVKDIIFRISLIILIAEAFIMQLLAFFPHQMNVWEETLFDAVLLVIFTTPIIYFWIINPFVIQNQTSLQKISHLTFYDDLTGLPNTTKLYDWLEYSIKTSYDTNQIVSLLLFDLHRFKKVHDSFGLDISNDIILQVSHRLSTCTDHKILLTRIGPSTFVFIVENAKSNDYLYQLAKQILETLSTPFLSGKHSFNLDASIGISSYPKDADNKEDLLKHAHAAMRQAKSNDYEHIHFYTNDLTALIQKHFLLEEDLRQAIQEDEFYVLYQPKIDSHSNKLMGVEALIRWQHPTKGIINPIDFLSVAEESGLIIPIGELVLKKAIQQQEIWKSEGKTPIIMSINLSGRQLKEESIESIINILHTTSTPTIELEFEITETYLMEKPERSQLLLEKLHQTGISLAMDDFGTGYSSLGYLKRFHIDVLKIDKILIDDIESDESDFAIVQAIIAMAHVLNIKVVAEGVETNEQVEMLRSIGCDYFQGYYFSKPVDADSIYLNSNYII